MTDIALSEVSIVDYPAHMVHGYAVIKSANPDSQRALTSALRKEAMPEIVLAEVLKDQTVEDIRAALTDEQLAELAPVVAKSEEPADGDILKGVSDEVRAEFAKRDAEIAEIRKARDEEIEKARVEKEARLDSEAITKSKTEYTNVGFEHEVVAPALRKFAAESPEAAEAIETMMKAVNAQVADGTIFKTIGTTTEPTGKTAAEQITDLAKAKSTAEGTSFSKAYTDVVADPANAALVNAHFEEN